MTFGKVYGSILQPFIEKYKEAKNEKGRTTIINNAVDAVTTFRGLHEDLGDELPTNLKAVCDFFIFCLLLMMFANLDRQSLH